MQQLLVTFTGEVERSLSTTERRAREMTASVGERVTDNAKAITEQFEKIRAVAEGEREQTTDALRFAYEKAVTDLSGMLKSTTEKFAEVGRDMRGMTGAIQRELEATREELRKGSSTCRARPRRAPRRCGGSSPTRSRR